MTPGRLPRRRNSGDARQRGHGYSLHNEHLIQFEAMSGIRSFCHLLLYQSADGPPVCVVGNFDDAGVVGTSTPIEMVATVVADQIREDEFRLIEWFPHDSERRFVEVELTHVEPTEVPTDVLSIRDAEHGEDIHTRRRSVLTRFADPRWTRLSEDDLAALLGEEAVRELRSYAGLPGNYTVERHFGSDGRRLLDAINAHNRRVGDDLSAEISEWRTEP
jgi:hypothetical protein